MREVKFRLWDEFNKYMDYEFYGMGGQGDYCVDINDFLKEHSEFLMQYTGLKDKNGREIYEGDIIEIEYIEDQIKTLHQVVWGGNEYPAWDVKPYWDGECNVFSDIYCSGYYKMKVIGNIYENSNLLEG